MRTSWVLIVPCIALLLVCYAGPSKAYAAGPNPVTWIYWVDDQGSPNGDGSRGNPFPNISLGIQAAIQYKNNHPNNAVEVWVLNGTYQTSNDINLDLQGYAIKVRSASNSPSDCVIDGHQSGRAFIFHSGEGAGSIVQGFTIQNGLAANGGGLSITNSSSPSIVNCIIGGDDANPTLGNHATSNGGGVYIEGGSSPTFTDCSILRNVSENGSGGGVYIHNTSSPSFNNCSIQYNQSQSLSQNVSGGGVFISSYSNPTFNGGGGITDNEAQGPGGGVYCIDHCTVSFTDLDIYSNQALGHGGGVYCDQYCTLNFATSNPAPYNKALGNNTAYRPQNNAFGGGIYSAFCALTFTNYDISRNNAKDYGGGAYFDDSFVTMTMCRIEYNELSPVGQCGGGLFFWGTLSSQTSVIDRCFIDGNYTPDYINVQYGGGIYLKDTKLKIMGNPAVNPGSPEDPNVGPLVQIYDNQATEQGGAIYATKSSLEVYETEIHDNRAGEGAGIACFDCGNYPQMRRTYIYSNECTGYNSRGGALLLEVTGSTNSMSAYITNCGFSGNEAGDAQATWACGGGAVYVGAQPLNQPCHADFVNCIFAENQVQNANLNFGGAVFSDEWGTVEFTNCTFYANNAHKQNQGGSVYRKRSNPNFLKAVLYNCILWGGAYEELASDSTNAFDVQYSDVMGGWSGTGNINADPKFVMQGQFYWDNFKLQPVSPCIDAGNNTFINNKPDILDVDVDGNVAEPTPDFGFTNRIKGTSVDMGAWEK